MLYFFILQSSRQAWFMKPMRRNRAAIADSGSALYAVAVIINYGTQHNPAP